MTNIEVTIPISIEIDRDEVDIKSEKDQRGKHRESKEPEKTVKGKVSPGIEKMRKVFEIEKEKTEEKSDTEVIGKVKKLKSSFELLMDPERRLKEAKKSREREEKKIERREKREGKRNIDKGGGNKKMEKWGQNPLKSRAWRKKKTRGVCGGNRRGGK